MGITPTGDGTSLFGKTVRVRTPDGYRVGAIKGVRSRSNGSVTEFNVDYTDVERPAIWSINNVEYPSGYSDWFSPDDIELIDEE
jgi:hypothetical protein